LAAEIYSHLGPGKITLETQIVPHENARGGRAKPTRDSYSAGSADHLGESDTAADAAPTVDASPESTRLTSGVSSENADNPQVAPESTPPDSGRVDAITKDGHRTTDTNNGPARARPSVGCAPDEPASGSDRPDSSSTATCQDEPHAKPTSVSQVQTARESNDNERQDNDATNETLSKEEAQAAIRQILTTPASTSP